MRFYTARINLDGDVRHVVQKRGLSAAELLVLQAVHGRAAVHNIVQEPQQKAKDNTPHRVIADHLDRRYGRVRIGPDNDPRPVLPQVFPGWPNVRFPSDAKDAGLDPELFSEPPAKRSGGGSKRSSAKAEEAAPAESTAEPDFAE